MTKRAVIFCLLAATNVSPRAWSQLSCRVTVRVEAVIEQPVIWLADLLQPGTCSEIFEAAAGVRIGSRPLAGSPRVMEGDAVRALLQRTADTEVHLRNRALLFNVPPRITLRSASARPPLAFEARERTSSGRHSTLLKAGQHVELLWDHAGIRLKIPAISLESGQAGQTVRARIAGSGQVLRAIVLPDGTLRANS